MWKLLENNDNMTFIMCAADNHLCLQTIHTANPFYAVTCSPICSSYTLSNVFKHSSVLGTLDVLISISVSHIFASVPFFGKEFPGTLIIIIYFLSCQSAIIRSVFYKSQLSKAPRLSIWQLNKHYFSDSPKLFEA